MNVIGFSTRLSGQGKQHPYLAALEIDGRLRTSLIALPADQSYVIPPVHPLYGNLLTGPTIDQVMAAIRSHVAGRHILCHAENRGLSVLAGMDMEFIETDIIESGEQAHSQITALHQVQTKRQAA